MKIEHNRYLSEPGLSIAWETNTCREFNRNSCKKAKSVQFFACPKKKDRPSKEPVQNDLGKINLPMGLFPVIDHLKHIVEIIDKVGINALFQIIGQVFKILLVVLG